MNAISDLFHKKVLKEMQSIALSITALVVSGCAFGDGVICNLKSCSETPDAFLENTAYFLKAKIDTVQIFNIKKVEANAYTWNARFLIKHEGISENYIWNCDMFNDPMELARKRVMSCR